MSNPGTSDPPKSSPWLLTTIDRQPTTRFVAHPGLPGTTIVTAVGDVDASNAVDFATLAVSYPDETARLMIDMRDVEFISAAGFSALHAINDRCTADDVDWAIVPSAAVHRLLSICDAEAAMPTREQTDPTLLLELVTEPR